MKQDGKFFYGWIVLLGGVLIITFTIPLINSLNSMYMISVTEDLGLSRSQYALTGTIVSVMTVIMSPIAGKIYGSGKFKIKTVQTIALLGLCLSYGSYYFAHSAMQLYISAFCVGLFFITAAMIPTSIIINNWFVAKRGVAMSIAMLGISFGSMLLATPMTNLIMQYGWRSTRAIMMVVMLAVCIPVSLFVMKDKPEDKGLKAFGLGVISSTSKGKEKEPAATVENNIPLKYAKKTGFFWILSIGLLFNGFIAGGTIQNYTPFFTGNFGAETAAWLISLGSFMAIIGKLVIGYVFDKLGNKNSVIIGTICGTAVFVIYSLFGSNLTVVTISTFLDGMGTTMQTMGMNLLVASIFGTVNYAEVYGAMKMWQQAGMAVGAVVIAFIFDLANSYSIAWIICAAMMLFSGLSLVYADVAAKKANAQIQLEIEAEGSK